MASLGMEGRQPLQLRTALSKLHEAAVTLASKNGRLDVRTIVRYHLNRYAESGYPLLFLPLIQPGPSRQLLRPPYCHADDRLKYDDSRDATE
jgi:hypothetical protein